MRLHESNDKTYDSHIYVIDWSTWLAAHADVTSWTKNVWFRSPDSTIPRAVFFKHCTLPISILIYWVCAFSVMCLYCLWVPLEKFYQHHCLIYGCSSFNWRNERKRAHDWVRPIKAFQTSYPVWKPINLSQKSATSDFLKSLDRINKHWWWQPGKRSMRDALKCHWK